MGISKRCRCIKVKVMIERKFVDYDTSKIKKEQERLIPVRRYKNYRQDLSQGTVNGLILKRNENGLAPHVVRINGRLYLIEGEWEQWLLSHREAPQIGSESRELKVKRV
jgi:hypothetical protein